MVPVGTSVRHRTVGPLGHDVLLLRAARCVQPWRVCGTRALSASGLTLPLPPPSLFVLFLLCYHLCGSSHRAPRGSAGLTEHRSTVTRAVPRSCCCLYQWRFLLASALAGRGVYLELHSSSPPSSHRRQPQRVCEAHHSSRASRSGRLHSGAQGCQRCVHGGQGFRLRPSDHRRSACRPPVRGLATRVAGGSLASSSDASALRSDHVCRQVGSVQLLPPPGAAHLDAAVLCAAGIDAGGAGCMRPPSHSVVSNVPHAAHGLLSRRLPRTVCAYACAVLPLRPASSR